jgi:hypothetical protein
MLLTYGSARPTRTQRLDTGIANLETWMQKQRTEPGIRLIICASFPGKADPPRRYKSEYALPAVVQKQDAIGWQSSGRPALLGWSEVQHRYYEFRQPNRASLVDCSYPEIMGCSMGHVGSPQPSATRPGILVTFIRLTDEFTGSVGLAREAKLLSGGLPSLLQRLPAYQTAWLIRIQAARARAERRDGQRQAHQRDTFNPERLECNGG